MSASRRLRRHLAAAFLLAAIAAFAAGFWIPIKAEVAQLLLERSWQAARAGRPGVRPWPWADTWPVARLSVPDIGSSWIVLAGASGRNLAFAPTQLDGSAAPGEPGTTVIAGHRDTHFTVLEGIAAGTRIELENADGTVFRYVVQGTRIVDSRTSRLRLDGALPLLVLTTCYPFDAVVAGGPLRFLVEAAIAD